MKCQLCFHYIFFASLWLLPKIIISSLYRYLVITQLRQNYFYARSQVMCYFRDLIHRSTSNSHLNVTRREGEHLKTAGQCPAGQRHPGMVFTRRIFKSDPSLILLTLGYAVYSHTFFSF